MNNETLKIVETCERRSRADVPQSPVDTRDLCRIIREQDAENERLRNALEWFVDDAETTLSAGLLDEFNESQLRSKVQETRSWLAKS